MYDDEQTEEESARENWAAQAIGMALLIILIYSGVVWFFTMSGIYQ